MTRNIIDIKKDIHDAWNILKNEKQSFEQKNASAKSLVKLYEEVQTIPNHDVKIIDLANTSYAHLLGDAPQKSGFDYEKYLPQDYEGQKNRYLAIKAVAHKIVTEEDPNLEAKNPNLFGQIRNATIASLIALQD